MKSRVVLCSLVLAALALAACGGHDDPQPFAAATDLESRLEADTGAKWDLYGASSPGSGSLLLLGPQKPVHIQGSSREEKARKFFEVYGDALPQLAGLGQPAAAEELADADGSNVVKIAFVVPGTSLPVFDTATAVHFDATGAVRYVEPGPSADVVGMGTTPGARRDGRASLCARRDRCQVQRRRCGRPRGCARRLSDARSESATRLSLSLRRGCPRVRGTRGLCRREHR